HATRCAVTVAIDADVAEQLRPSGGHARARASARGRRPLLDQLHVRAHPRAIRARARLGCGEAALLAAIDRPLARHQRPPLAADPAWPPDSIVERMSVRRR